MRQGIFKGRIHGDTPPAFSPWHSSVEAAADEHPRSKANKSMADENRRACEALIFIGACVLKFNRSAIPEFDPEHGSETAKHGNCAVPSSCVQSVSHVCYLWAPTGTNPLLFLAEKGTLLSQLCTPRAFRPHSESGDFYSCSQRSSPRVLVHPRRQCAKEGKAIEKKRLNLAQARCSFLQKAPVSSDR